VNTDNRFDLFALTPGHVIAESIDDLIYALAEKRFQEVVKALDVLVSDERMNLLGNW